jgi:hypothetical protein
MANRIVRSLLNPRYRLLKVFFFLGLSFIGLLALVAGTGLIRDLTDPRSAAFLSWGMGNLATRESLIISRQEPCPGAPFILPAEGFIGLLYADPRGPYSNNNPHQGLDIFSPDRDTPGLVPVYAASDGYITREIGWRSSLIQRIPSDPLQPDNQIWLYYTHMANQEGIDFITSAIPPGTQELFVEQGTILGYTGNYNGNSIRSIWVHLHFSIVKDDGADHYANELEFNNTIDPSPYLGLAVNYACSTALISCLTDPTCN